MGILKAKVSVSHTGLLRPGGLTWVAACKIRGSQHAPRLRVNMDWGLWLRRPPGCNNRIVLGLKWPKLL